MQTVKILPYNLGLGNYLKIRIKGLLILNSTFVQTDSAPNEKKVLTNAIPTAEQSWVDLRFENFRILKHTDHIRIPCAGFQEVSFKYWDYLVYFLIYYFCPLYFLLHFFYCNKKSIQANNIFDLDRIYSVL